MFEQKRNMYVEDGDATEKAFSSSSIQSTNSSYAGGSKGRKHWKNKCDKFGHIAKDCRSKMIQLVHCAQQMEEETSMFFACYSATMIKNEHVWFIDSGCSNHMISYKSLLIYVCRSVNTMIKMGNGQIV